MYNLKKRLGENYVYKTKRDIGEQEKNEILKFLQDNRLGSIILKENDYYKIGVVGDKKMLI